MASENLSPRGQAWFCTTGLPTDVVIEVGDMSFHLHKFPLMSKSRKLHHLITEREQNPRAQRRQDSDVEGGEEEIEAEPATADEEEEEEDFPHICLPEFPGGLEAFETAAKFCYGVKIELTASKVVPLRCAAEYLDMTEDFAENNLVARTERFLAQSVLRSVRDAAKALKSCELLLPQAEDLGLVQRCVDAIAARASGTDLNSLFGWPILEAGNGGAIAVVAGAADQSRGSSSNSAAGHWNGTDNGERRKGGIRYTAGSGFHDSWFEDLTALSLPIYKRVISAMKAKNLRPELIEGSLIFYAKRSIPGLSRSNRHHAAATPLPSQDEQRELLETLITNLPQEKSSGLLATRLLSGLLRTVNILRASEDSRAVLERKIGSQLDRAALDDLLMPSYSYLVETLYDVDCVERIVGHFLASLEEEQKGATTADLSDDDREEKDRNVVEPPGGDDNSGRIRAVGKLVDGYLSEIASDANVKPDKFCDLALALPDHARVFDDGLYRAVDVYLKAHPRLTEEEKEKVCGVMDCRKLTLEACTHAAQNERLPLRAVVQVLFFEQLQLRRAIAGTLMNAETEAEEEEKEEEEETAAEREEAMSLGERARRSRRRGRRSAAAVQENQVLRLDMDSMRSRVMGLERECSRMRKALEKIDHRRGAVVAAAAAAAAAGSWGSLTRRLGCKFSTQVCDTTQHQQQPQRTVVAPRKQRIEYNSS